MIHEDHFARFRNNIIGCDAKFEGPYGIKDIVYTDWTASGRMYMPIERQMMEKISPFVANTHTETNITGTSMTLAYKQAREIIKRHVNASPSDVLITSNSGMTGVVNKFQRILGIKIHERYQHKIDIPKNDRPIVFVSHMEHHSNQTSWLETIAEVRIIEACNEGLVNMANFIKLLEEYKDRTIKIAAITSCSNVTGIMTPYHEIAKIIHGYGGLCFVDFACSAPYIDIDMHPQDESAALDAIYFSPHKFLGGPGSNGVLIFNKKLYKNRVPDHPGGGTVEWTNPWGEHKYSEEIEAREDGGTPGFLQTIRIALAINLKEQMGVKMMLEREHEMIEKIWAKLLAIPNLHLFAPQHKDRLGVVSFYIEDLHYNLAVKLLNDRFGIQVRGGCSCAGTYGHYLLEVSKEFSKSLTSLIDVGDLSEKPGWIRMSIHPTLSEKELDYALDAIESLCINHVEWAKDYTYNARKNEFCHNSHDLNSLAATVSSWFTVESL